MSALTTHERIRRMYEHRDADRVPILDSPWKETIDRWVREGLPSRDYVRHFDLDRVASIWIDNSPRYPKKILEEDERYRIYTTEWGLTLRSWTAHGSTPEFLDFTITSSQAWQEAKARMLEGEDRVDWARLKKEYAGWKTEGRWIRAGLWFGFDVAHSWAVGTERVLMAMVEEPEWCQDMFNTFLDVDITWMDRLWDAGYTFDEIEWPDDMGYKHNQFFSLKMYRELLKPVHKRAADWAHAHGVKVHLHSCGDVNPFVPELIEIGIDALNPLEVKAGMDPVHLKETYGDKLVFHGGINAVLWDKPDQIIDEINRVVPRMKENGGYIFASDHSIPENVSLQDFTTIIAAAKRAGSYA
jgi:uroporphyrinogen decarboxylase